MLIPQFFGEIPAGSHTRVARSFGLGIGARLALEQKKPEIGKEIKKMMMKAKRMKRLKKLL